MAELTITVPDPQVPRIQAAFGTRLGLVDGANLPRDATTEEVRQQLIQHLQGVVLAEERKPAIEAAADAVTPITPS